LSYAQVQLHYVGVAFCDEILDYVGCAECGVSCKWYFLVGSEDAYVVAAVCGLVFLDEGGFGEVGFVGYPLHLFCSEVGGVSDYGKLVTLIFGFGEYVDYVEAVLGHAVHGLCVFGGLYIKKAQIRSPYSALAA
jgi:hypothetical protein